MGSRLSEAFRQHLERDFNVGHGSILTDRGRLRVRCRQNRTKAREQTSEVTTTMRYLDVSVSNKREAITAVFGPAM